MSTFPGPANAVVYAQFVRQGGWKRICLAGGIYGIVVGGLFSAAHVIASSPSRSAILPFLVVLLVLQAMALFVFGGFQVESAVRLDVTSRMLESHRLMPATSLAGILGYLSGGPLQAYVLFLVNVALGMACCFVGGVPIEEWLGANLVMLFSALFVYTFLIQTAFVMRGGFILVLVASLILPGMGASGSLEAIPSLHALLYLIASPASFVAQVAGASSASFAAELRVGYAASFLGQLFFALIAIRVATRRYGMPSNVGITPILGVMLVAVWVGLAVADIWIPMRWGMLYEESSDAIARNVISLGTSMLLAMLPLAGAARISTQRSISGPARPGRSFDSLLTLLAVTAIIIALAICLAGADYVHSFHRSALSAAVVFNFLLFIILLFTWGYRRRGWPWLWASILVVLTWAIPPITDSMYTAATRQEDSYTAITGFSPVGWLALMWSNTLVDLMPGLVGQALLTGLMLVVVLLTKRRGVEAQQGLPQAKK